MGGVAGRASSGKLSRYPSVSACNGSVSPSAPHLPSPHNLPERHDSSTASIRIALAWLEELEQEGADREQVYKVVELMRPLFVEYCGRDEAN